MRVARLHAKGYVQLHEEECPESAEGMSLVRVTDVGLCGSDLHWFADGQIGDAQIGQRPLVLGHEISGVVEAGPLAGTRVAVDPAIPCGGCILCLQGQRNLCPTVRFAGHGEHDGGLREFMTWPTALLHPLPDAITTTEGAVLEPLGVAMHALDLSGLRTGGSAAVMGCGLNIRATRLSRSGLPSPWLPRTCPIAVRRSIRWGSSVLTSPSRSRA